MSIKKHYVVYVHRIHVAQAHLHTQGAYFNVVIVVDSVLGLILAHRELTLPN